MTVLWKGKEQRLWLNVVFQRTTTFKSDYLHTGYPQRLKRRLYGIYTVCFRIFKIPWNFEVVFSLPSHQITISKADPTWFWCFQIQGLASLDLAHILSFFVVFSVSYIVSTPGPVSVLNNNFIQDYPCKGWEFREDCT